MEGPSGSGGRLRAFASAFLLLAAARPAGADVHDGEPFDLLVIGPREFLAPLAGLEAHKDSTGLPTDVVELERVLEFFPEHPEYDPAERVKRALAYYRERFGIRYALLVGDVDKFPVRWVARNARDDPETTLYYFPSDLYYADLYDARGAWCDWDYDRDERFGEHLEHADCALDPFAANVDRCDLRPDIAVGRVPASTAEEVERYVAKVIRHEHHASSSASAQNVLLLAGGSRRDACDPGIHFADIEHYLGSGFQYTVYVHGSYYDRSLDPDRICECDPWSVTTATCPCFSGFGQNRRGIFSVATHWDDGSPIPKSAFEATGFLAWHDHTSTVADYGAIDNSKQYTIAFSDGCEDGAFAGSVPGGFYRFVPASARGPDAPYRTATGELFRIVFEPRWLVDSNGDSVVNGADAAHYCILRCEVDGATYRRDGDRFADISPARRFPFPTLRIEDDFGGDCVADPLATPADPKPRWDRGLPYIYNAPPPASLQPQPDVPDDDRRNSETKLFAVWFPLGGSAQETGWVGVVAATKGASFPTNGELEALFFRGYADPHPSVGGRTHLGDMWRSMIEHMLDYVVDPATGRFDFTAYARKYTVDPDYPTNCWSTIEHLMMESLFGDPSLRALGVPGLSDTRAPTAYHEVRGDGTNRVTITIVPTDPGTTPSGVRRVWYRIDGGGERVGRRISIEEDGAHAVEYWAEDWLGNVMDPHGTAHVTVDAVAPTTAIASIAGPVRTSAMCYCFAEDSCYPEGGCFDGDVTVELAASETASAIAYTEYSYPGLPAGLLGGSGIYTGPFVVPRPEEGCALTLSYRSVDVSGNEEPWNEAILSFCNLWNPGFAGTSRTIRPALAGTARYALRDELFRDPSEIRMVGMEYAVPPVGPGEPQWIAAALDSQGSDGWNVAWDTTKVPDGEYLIRLTAFGPPLKPGGSPAPIHTDVRSFKVCNISPKTYEFLLSAPPAADRGASVLFEARFRHRFGKALAAPVIACALDLDPFASIEVLDGGVRDKEGRPTWSRGSLAPDEPWTVRFKAVLSPDARPGAEILARAFLTAPDVALLVSDDPETAGPSDPTRVVVNPSPGAIEIEVEEDPGEAPLRATVYLYGPIERKETADSSGRCRFASLPPGAYRVEVAAPGYECASPAGPVSLTLRGVGEVLTAEFSLRHADALPPESRLALWPSEIAQRGLRQTSGTAHDGQSGSGVSKVEVSIVRREDAMSWNGQKWTSGTVWLPAKGTAEWTADLGPIEWARGFSYAIATRATDRAGNVEVPRPRTAAPIATPSLLSPPPGSTVDGVPTFRWSEVPASTYRLQVDREGDFRAPEIDVVRGGAPEFTPTALESGPYSWRVRAVRTRSIERVGEEHFVPIDPTEPPEASDWTEAWIVHVESAAAVFHRGDFNDDGKADISDAVAGLSFLFLGGPPSRCREAGDVDNSGSLEITDAIFLLGWLFLGGPEPPPPGPSPRPCGPDRPDPSSGDTTYLGCETYRNCP